MTRSITDDIPLSTLQPGSRYAAPTSSESNTPGSNSGSDSPKSRLLQPNSSESSLSSSLSSNYSTTTQSSTATQSKKHTELDGLAAVIPTLILWRFYVFYGSFLSVLDLQRLVGRVDNHPMMAVSLAYAFDVTGGSSDGDTASVNNGSKDSSMSANSNSNNISTKNNGNTTSSSTNSNSNSNNTHAIPSSKRFAHQHADNLLPTITPTLQTLDLKPLSATNNPQTRRTRKLLHKLSKQLDIPPPQIQLAVALYLDFQHLQHQHRNQQQQSSSPTTSSTYAALTARTMATRKEWPPLATIIHLDTNQIAHYGIIPKHAREAAWVPGELTLLRNAITATRVRYFSALEVERVRGCACAWTGTDICARVSGRTEVRETLAVVSRLELGDIEGGKEMWRERGSGHIGRKKHGEKQRQCWVGACVGMLMGWGVRVPRAMCPGTRRKMRYRLRKREDGGMDGERGMREGIKESAKKKPEMEGKAEENSKGKMREEDGFTEVETRGNENVERGKAEEDGNVAEVIETESEDTVNVKEGEDVGSGKGKAEEVKNKGKVRSRCPAAGQRTWNSALETLVEDDEER